MRGWASSLRPYLSAAIRDIRGYSSSLPRLPICAARREIDDLVLQNASRPSCRLGLLAVVTGVRGNGRGAVRTKRGDYFLFARFLAPFLALVDFLAFFLAIFRDSCHMVSNA
jgi:hypothetical protein